MRYSHTATRPEQRITRHVTLDDAAWAKIAPVLPPLPARRHRYAGRRPTDDRTVLTGVLTVLANDIGFEMLPVELGYGSGITAWRRLRYWHDAGAWPAIAERLREAVPDVDLGRVDGLFSACGQRRRRGPGGDA